MNLIRKIISNLFSHRCSFDKPIISKYYTFTCREIIYECKCGKRKKFKVYRSYGCAFPIQTTNLITEKEFNKYLK